MVSRAPWSDESDAELRRLAERGFSIARLTVAMKRSGAFLARRLIALGITLKRPQRLTYSERVYGSGAEHNPRVRNTSQ